MHGVSLKLSKNIFPEKNEKFCNFAVTLYVRDKALNARFAIVYIGKKKSRFVFCKM